MSDTHEVLARAAVALREEYDGTSEVAELTKRRVVAGARPHSRAASWRTRLVIAVAAALVTSAAWAGATGRLRPVLGALEHIFRAGHEVEPAPPPSPLASPSPVPAPMVTSSASPDAAAEPDVPPPAPPSPTTSREAPPPSTARAAALAVDADAVYRAAHEAHFGKHDYPAALEGWNRYLAVAPNGPYAIEARYNRAIALIRLGRDGEAREALRPFVEGDYGAYRRDEARALVDHLDRRRRE